MRLLHIEQLDFTEFCRDDKRPPYVIASHRWHEESEVTFQDVQNKHNVDRDGYKKIKSFAKYIKDHVRSVEWLWIDTCCINKDSSAELSEAVNLMFEWYHGAELCLAYLADVRSFEVKSTFEQSEWFQRGWTLQELLAPRTVVFVTEDWQVIGSKGNLVNNKSMTFTGPRLEEDIARITGIPKQVLYDFKTSSSLSIDQRLKWMESRRTTREEDMSYALYGIFGIAPGANYGEKREGARRRLLAAIKYQDDIAAQQTERFRKVVDWLSPADPWTNHTAARSLHEPQTGMWLIASDQYRRWKSAAIRNLWLYGKAGSGKTILCSTAIEDVRRHCERSPNSGYAIFYFSFSDGKKQRYGDLLCSLVAQLGWKGSALIVLQQAYEEPNRNQPGVAELENILVLCLEAYHEIFLLIDALDECPEDGDMRHSMLECLIRLSQRSPHVKILATSRKLPDIRESMEALKSEAMPLDTCSVDVDIRHYVATQLSHDYRLSRLDRKMTMLIEERISAKADGMFRWAYCQMQELKKLKSSRPTFLKEALFSLPTSLDETYERMLASIDKRLHTDALKLLRWLAYARSPPSLGELADATVIDLKAGGNVDVEDRPGLDDAIEILSGLVVVERDKLGDNEAYGIKETKRKWQQYEQDEVEPASHHQQFKNDTKIRLAHFSVKEYLESKRILESSAKNFYCESAREHGNLSQSCLVYLTHYSNCGEKLSTSRDLTTFPLLRYTAESWYYHSALQEDVNTTREVAFLCSETALRDWLRVHQPDRTWIHSFGELNNIGSSLYNASFAGLERVIGDLLKTGADINAQGGFYGNALHAASFGGHEKVVQMLTDAGANVNAQGGFYGNALQAASWKGHEKVVQLLIDTGADINAQGGEYGNALQAASEGGYRKVVRILMHIGADINALGGPYGNALHAASRWGHKKVVQMLIDAGADVHAHGGLYGNALQAASFGGHEKVVQLLIDAGADVNSQGGEYDNALQAASFGGHEKVIQTLIDAGVDVNAPEGPYNNALQAASFGGYTKVCQMLISVGADVNAQGGEYGNALQAASFGGYERVVQMLIDVGADVNSQGGLYSNALQAASFGGYEKVVQMLIDVGANVNAQGGLYGNALQAASFRGYMEVVKMLLDTGADINAQGGLYSNALHAASFGGHIMVAQILSNGV